MNFAGFSTEDILNTLEHVKDIIAKVDEKKKIIEAKLTTLAVDALIVKD